MRFLPPDFDVPELLEIDRFRIRPLTIHDVVKDYDAVMTSRQHLWEQFGQAWDWPSEDLTLEQDLIDLASHQKEAQRRSSFAYAVMRPDERLQLGCVYIAPPRSKALTPRPPCGSGPARRSATWTRCCMRPCGVGLPSAGRSLGLPGPAGSCHGTSTTPCPTSDRQAGRTLAEPGMPGEAARLRWVQHGRQCRAQPSSAHQTAWLAWSSGWSSGRSDGTCLDPSGSTRPPT
jgi:hypothetical protein